MQMEQAIRDLVRETDTYLARFEGAGVSDVRAGIARWRDGPIRPLSGRRLSVLGLIDQAVGCLAESGERSLANAIERAVPYLPWITYPGYDRDVIGVRFAENHAHASFMGEDGLIKADDYDLGLFIIAPNTLYRDHKHAAPELYAPLTGPHGWRFAPGAPLTWKAAHQPVWNEPFQPHAIKVGDVPFLCIFGWTRDVREIARVVPALDWDVIERTQPAL